MRSIQRNHSSGERIIDDMRILESSFLWLLLLLMMNRPCNSGRVGGRAKTTRDDKAAAVLDRNSIVVYGDDGGSRKLSAPSKMPTLQQAHNEIVFSFLEGKTREHKAMREVDKLARVYCTTEQQVLDLYCMHMFKTNVIPNISLPSATFPGHLIVKTHYGDSRTHLFQEWASHRLAQYKAAFSEDDTVRHMYFVHDRKNSREQTNLPGWFYDRYIVLQSYEREHDDTVYCDAKMFLLIVRRRSEISVKELY